MHHGFGTGRFVWMRAELSNRRSQTPHHHSYLAALPSYRERGTPLSRPTTAPVVVRRSQFAAGVLLWLVAHELGNLVLRRRRARSTARRRLAAAVAAPPALVLKRVRVLLVPPLGRRVLR